MLTRRMLGLLHTRLVANAPRQAGSDEYRMGVDDAIAAVRRLIEAGGPSDLTGPSWRMDEPPEGVNEPEEANQTQLAAEYLHLELTSLLRTIDSLLRQQTAPPPRGDTAAASLLDAKAHLVEARGALRQTQGSVPG